MTKVCCEQEYELCCEIKYPNWMNYCVLCGWQLINLESLQANMNNMVNCKSYDDIDEFFADLHKVTPEDIAHLEELEKIKVSNERLSEVINIEKSNIIYPKITIGTGTSIIHIIDEEEMKARGMSVVVIDKEHPFVYEIEFSSEDLKK